MRRFLFRHTVPRALDRLGPADRAAAARLDAWLDAQGADHSSDFPTAAVDPGLARAARRLHELSARADISEPQMTDAGIRQRIWEDLMAQRPVPTRSGSSMPPVASGSERPVRSRVPDPVRVAKSWSPAFNVSMVLVLLVALVAGVAGFYSHHTGGDTPTPPAQLAAIASPASDSVTTRSTPASTGAAIPTTVGAPAPEETFGGAIPTPAECTVKPLTIDEVMARLGYTPLTPAEQEATRNAELTRIAEFDPNAALPGPGTPLAEPTRRTGEPGRPPTDAEMKGVVAAHRQLIACIMKRSPLQIWAMIDPENPYWRELAAFAIPPFTDPAIVRAKLEGFLSGKNWLFPDPWQMLPPLSSETPMVNLDPATATAYQNPDYLDNSVVISVSMVYYSPMHPGTSPYTTSIVTSPSYGRDQDDGWSYRYNPKLKQWLLMFHSGNFSQQG